MIHVTVVSSLSSIFLHMYSLIFALILLHVLSNANAFPTTNICIRRSVSIAHVKYMCTHDNNANSNATNNATCACTSSSSQRRRLLLQHTVQGLVPSTSMIVMMVDNEAADAFPVLPFSQGRERRQLELCLVIILRVQSWVQNVASNMVKMNAVQRQQDDEGDINNVQVQAASTTSVLDKNQWNVSAYLEARLGAKALLTGRVGGGAPPRVYDLAQFQIRECVDDLVYVSKSLGLQREAQNDVDVIIDALASIVEFDGLETTIDPSPRSSLMISMFDAEKGIYVKRMMNERLIPACRRITRLYGGEIYIKCKRFMDINYPKELI